jgi:hypothetical protein
MRMICTRSGCAIAFNAAASTSRTRPVTFPNVPMQRCVCKLSLGRVVGVMMYEDAGWPFWLRALIAIFAAGLVAVMGWRYYKRYWRK